MNRKHFRLPGSNTKKHWDLRFVKMRVPLAISRVRSCILAITADSAQEPINRRTNAGKVKNAERNRSKTMSNKEEAKVSFEINQI